MIDLEAGTDDSPLESAVMDPAPSEPSPSSPATDAANLASDYDFDSPAYNQPEKPASPTPESPAPSGAVADPSSSAAGSGTQVESSVSPQLAQRAASMGFTPEVMAAFSNPVHLELAVSRAEQAAINGMLFAQRPQQPAQQAQPAPLPAPPQAPAPYNEAAHRASMAHFDETLQNQLVEQAKAQHAAAVQQHQIATQLWEHSKYARDMYAYAQRQDQQIAAMQQRHELEMINRDYEQFTSGLSEAAKKVVSDQNARATILQAANALLVGMQQTGQKLPSNPEAFKMAMYATMADKLNGMAVEQVREEVRTHQRRAVARPGGSSSRSGGGIPLGPERAAQFAESFMRKIGLSGGGGGNNFPDV